MRSDPSPPRLAEVNNYDVRRRREYVFACIIWLTFGRFESNQSGSVYPGPLDTTLFRDPRFTETFRVIPVHLRVIGLGEDPERPNRSRLLFAGEVRDGQTMTGFVEVTPDGHLRWKWVRFFTFYLLQQRCSH